MSEIDFGAVYTTMKVLRDNLPREVHKTDLSIEVEDEPDDFVIRMFKPKNCDWNTFKLLREFGFIEVTNDGKRGFGRNHARVERITVKGYEFIELSSNDTHWHAAIKLCDESGSKTISCIMRELRRLARSEQDRVRRK